MVLFEEKECEGMLRLRPYKASDAEAILNWCRNEITFRRWTGDRYDKFPITEADMNRKYFEFNGDCSEPDNFYPFTVLDGNDIIGHFILRYVDEVKKVLRIGFVIVDDKKRGMGYGTEMIRLAVKYCFEFYGADKITIGAFENNPSAYKCYKNSGFKEIASEECFYAEVCGEKWRIIELEINKEI